MLIALYADLNPHHTMPSMSRARKIWQAIENQTGRSIFVAMVDDTLAGTIDCVITPNLTANGRSMMLIENMYVAQSFHRKGIGKQLIEHAEEVARAADCYKIQVLSSNSEQANAFYSDVGFNSITTGFRRYLRSSTTGSIF